jgi:hypothetical protein
MLLNQAAPPLVPSELTGDGLAAWQLAVLAPVGQGPIPEPAASCRCQLPADWGAQSFLPQKPRPLASRSLCECVGAAISADAATGPLQLP